MESFAVPQVPHTVGCVAMGASESAHAPHRRRTPHEVFVALFCVTPATPSASRSIHRRSECERVRGGGTLSLYMHDRWPCKDIFFIVSRLQQNILLLKR